MSTGEPDSGTGPTLNNNDPISNNEDTDCDATEKVTATTTNANYDNIDGKFNVNNQMANNRFGFSFI